MNISADLTFVRIAGEQFDEYLNTEVLFYPIGSVAGMAMPQLTIGSWLETVWRLRAVQGSLDLAQRQVLDQAEAEVRRVRRLWSELYRNKAQREFKSRLDSWSWYLDELFSPGAGLSQKGAGYVEQVHMRFKLELLRQDVSQPSEQVMRLDSADRRLRARFVAGPFVWDSVLQPAAPPNIFWFLYGQPAAA